MYAHFAYGAWYLVLFAVDVCCFRWHGRRPVVWQRQLLKHRFRAPAGGEVKSFGTEKELAELVKAQAMYPDRYMYLGAGSKYSPWSGQRWGHYVKVLVTDHRGTPPSKRYGDQNSWGMDWDRFLQTEWVHGQGADQEL